MLLLGDDDKTSFWSEQRPLVCMYVSNYFEAGRINCAPRWGCNVIEATEGRAAGTEALHLYAHRRKLNVGEPTARVS